MDFEFDPSKSEANKHKHGIDFVEAQLLREDAMRVEVPARTADEPRLLVIGRVGGRHWSVVVTRRGERTRIISARRSLPEEVTIYGG